MNPEYEKLGIDPINIWMRNILGETIQVKDCNKIDELVEKMLMNRDSYKEKIDKFVSEAMYNIGHSAEVGGKYIIGVVQEKINERKKEN